MEFFNIHRRRSATFICLFNYLHKNVLPKYIDLPLQIVQLRMIYLPLLSTFFNYHLHYQYAICVAILIKLHEIFILMFIRIKPISF